MVRLVVGWQWVPSLVSIPHHAILLPPWQLCTQLSSAQDAYSCYKYIGEREQLCLGTQQFLALVQLRTLQYGMCIWAKGQISFWRTPAVTAQNGIMAALYKRPRQMTPKLRLWVDSMVFESVCPSVSFCAVPPPPETGNLS